jgi:signal peptidase I
MTEFEQQTQTADFPEDGGVRSVETPELRVIDPSSNGHEVVPAPVTAEPDSTPIEPALVQNSDPGFDVDQTSAPGFNSDSLPEADDSNREVNVPEPVRPLFRPLWSVGQSHAPFADVTLEDDLGVQVHSPEIGPPRWRLWARESIGIARDVALALAVAILIGVFVIQPVKVEGTSMLPRLHDGERIFINRFIYNFKKIERGDIVVFYYPKDPGKNFIKRVIGLPGDEITISNGKLRINGKLVPENYLSKDYTTNINAPHTWVVEPHHYFVMGDNRDASNDSRSWGYVPEMYIYGKAVFRYWPLSEAGSIGDDPADLKPLRELGRPSQSDPDEE